MKKGASWRKALQGQSVRFPGRRSHFIWRLAGALLVLAPGSAVPVSGRLSQLIPEKKDDGTWKRDSLLKERGTVQFLGGFSTDLGNKNRTIDQHKQSFFLNFMIVNMKFSQKCLDHSNPIPLYLIGFHHLQKWLNTRHHQTW